MKKKLLFYFIILIIPSILINVNILDSLYPEVIFKSWFKLLMNILFVIHILMVIGIIYELYKAKKNYKFVILIIFILTILPYHLEFLTTNIYFNFFAPEVKLEIERIYSGMPRNGIMELVHEFPSPFDYSPVQRIIINPLQRFYFLLENKNIFQMFIFLLRHEFFLLICFCKVILFKRPNLSMILSVIFPINYMLLIDKYQLSKTWKYLLVIPFVNIYFMYKINKEITKEYNLSNGNSLGMVLLPFIYYPKIVFTN